MSVRVMTRIWDCQFPTTSMKLVALKLADCANDDGENIYPSVDRVERDTGVSASVVRETIADMEASAVLIVLEEASGNRFGRSTTLRRFNLAALRGLAEGELRWGQQDVPVSDQKTGQQKTDPRTGAPKTRKAWRLVGSRTSEPRAGDNATPPDSGGAPSDPPLRWPEGHPSGSRTPPLRQPDPTPPAAGPKPLEEPSMNHPPTPPGAREGGNSISIFGWIEDLRAEGQPGLVLDELLVPMLSAGLKPWKDTDPCGPARQLCADFRRRSGPVLRAAADRLLDSERYRLPPVARFREAVAAEGKIAADAARNQVKRTAAEGDDLERFGRDTPEFQAALAKWRELDLRHAGVIDRRGFVRLKRGPPPGSPERTDQPDTIA